MADERAPTGVPATRPMGLDEDLERRRAELHARVERDFNYHPPRPGQELLYDELRKRHRELAHFLVDNLPIGRELHRSLSDLEDAVMHANAGIARSDKW